MIIWGKRDYRRFNTSLALRFDTPPDVIKLFIEGMNKIANNHPNTKKDSINIWMNNITDSALTVYFNVHLMAKDYTEESILRQEIIFDVLQLAHVLGVCFAHNTQTLHIEDFPEKASLMKQYPQDSVDKYDEFLKLNSQKYSSDNKNAGNVNTDQSKKK